MTIMGRHSPPVTGEIVANGHAPALVPFVIPAAMQGGPVSPWPQRDESGRWRHAVAAHRGWLAAVPIVLVNAVATGAQLGFWRAHLTAAQAVLVALALESIAIYLAWMSHLAQLADDSALRLRLAAYSFALVIGALNYSHFMLPGWRPTVAAVTFGLMSAVSPWLWSVHSRRVSRDALKADNQIEAHAVRLGATRWTWHPVLSYRVMRLATWEGENRPKPTIALLAGDVPAVQPREDKQADKVLDKPADKTAANKPSRKVTARTALDKAADAIRRHPDWADKKEWTRLAKSAGVSVKTVQRARNGTAKTP